MQGKNKLIKANESLHILRTLSKKKGHNKSEIDLLFNKIVLPNINDALSVYAASESDLTLVQRFLDRSLKGNIRLIFVLNISNF